MTGRRSNTETNEQREARLQLASYVKELIDDEFFSEDELPYYEWVVDTLKKAGV